MIDLPDLPEGSAIRAKIIADKVRLRWWAHPRARTGAWLIIAAALAGSGFLATMFFVTRLLVALPGASERPMVYVLAIILILALAAAVLAIFRIHRRGHEVLLLGPDSLTYTAPGKTSEAAREFTWEETDFVWLVSSLICGFPRLFLAFRSRDVSRAARNDVKRIALEGRGRFGSLVVALGEYRLEIGKRLRDADREWLYEVLRRWRGEAGPTPPSPASPSCSS